MPDDSMFVTRDELALPDEATPNVSLKVLTRQLILFPGYYITLPIAAVLDVAVGPIPVGDTAIAVPWLGLWLVQHAAGKILSMVVSSRRYALRLRSRSINSSSL